jgi:hypothetical protein
MNMKFISIKTVSAAMMTSLLLFSACTELTDGYSTDPVNITDPTVITTDKFMSGTLASLIGVYEGDMNRLTGMWVGYFSGEDRQYIGLSNYGVSGRDFNTEWGGIYSSVIKNAHIVKSRSHAENNTLMLAIAQVTEAMAVGLAADLWGDVPFTEMAQYPTIATPKYDDQASVYANVQTLLDSAIGNFELDVPNKLFNDAAGADFFFAGDAVAWTAVCHTLKARFYLHTRDYNNALLEAAQGISDVSGNMMAPHGSSYLQNFNLYYSFTNYDRPGYMAANGYAAALMDPANPDSRNNANTNENSRFNWYYLPNGDGTYDVNYLVDFDYGTPTEYNGFFGASTSFPMVTFEENALIVAEANMKQGNFDEALDALNSLRAYLNSGDGWSSGYNDNPTAMVFEDPQDPGFFLPYAESDFVPGGIENADGAAKEDALLREILEERYITLLGQLEGYNDIRRTGNYLGIPVKAGSSTVPLRLLYPQSELNTNPNVPSSGVGLFEPTKANSTPY